MSQLLWVQNPGAAQPVALSRPRARSQPASQQGGVDGAGGSAPEEAPCPAAGGRPPAPSREQSERARRKPVSFQLSLTSDTLSFPPYLFSTSESLSPRAGPLLKAGMSRDQGMYSKSYRCFFQLRSRVLSERHGCQTSELQWPCPHPEHVCVALSEGLPVETSWQCVLSV